MTAEGGDSLQDLKRLIRNPEGTPSEDDLFDIPFGEIALEQGFLRPEDLKSCLAEQRRRRQAGEEAIPIGRLLLLRGTLTLDQVHAILKIQGHRSPPDPPAAAAAPTEFGKYLLQRKIGRGGMATVYLAQDRELHRPVALKILDDDTSDPEAIRRLHREALIVAQLQHPHIVGIHEVGVGQDSEGRSTHFIAMDFIEGGSLAELLNRKETSRDDLLRIVEETAHAAGYAHGAGIVHRDIKPANILIDRAGRALLGDFGLARGRSLGSRLTHSGQVLGTPMYMAPEQAEGKTREIDARTDVFALGVLLYEILTGRSPFGADTPGAIFRRILEKDPVRPSILLPSIEADLEVLCLKALEKDRSRRYPTAKEFAEDLRRFRRGEPIQARPPSWGSRWKRRFAKRKAVVGTGILGVIATAIVAALLSVHFAQARRVDRSRTTTAKSESDRREAEAARIRRLEESKLKPLVEKLQETQALFYVGNADIGERLREMESALDELEQLALDPLYQRQREVWIVLGMGRFLTGDESRAERALLSAEAMGGADPRLNFYLGRIYALRGIESSLSLGLGEPETRERISREWSQKALRYLERDLRTGLGAEEIHQHVARAYVARAERDGTELARLCKEGILAFDPKPGAEEYWFLLGSAGPSCPKFADLLTQAIDRKPHWAWAYLLRGLVRGQLGLVQEALADLTQAIRIRPRFAIAYHCRGSKQYRLGALDAAMADYTEAIRIDPHFSPAYHDRGILKWNRGDFDGAITDYDEALRIDSEQPEVYLNRGFAKDSQQDLDGAISDFTEALRRNPRYARAYYGRGRARAHLGNRDGAMADYDEALRIDPELAEAYHTRGCAEFSQWEFERAIRDFTEAIRLKPRFALAYCERGRAKACLGDSPGALADFEEAIRIDPTLADPYLHRGWHRASQRDLEEGLRDFTEAIRRNPKLAWAYLGRGMARANAGDLAGALQDLEQAQKIGLPTADLREKAEEALRKVRSLLRKR